MATRTENRANAKLPWYSETRATPKRVSESRDSARTWKEPFPSGGEGSRMELQSRRTQLNEIFPGLLENDGDHRPLHLLVGPFTIWSEMNGNPDSSRMGNCSISVQRFGDLRSGGLHGRERGRVALHALYRRLVGLVYRARVDWGSRRYLGRAGRRSMRAASGFQDSGVASFACGAWARPGGRQWTGLDPA
jgi:hypothetical protein